MFHWPVAGDNTDVVLNGRGPFLDQALQCIIHGFHTRLCRTLHGSFNLIDLAIVTYANGFHLSYNAFDKWLNRNKRAVEAAENGEDACPIHATWSRAQRALTDQLKQATFADLAKADAAIEAGTYVYPEDAPPHRTATMRKGRRS